MMQITTPVALKLCTLFDSVPDDYLNFGLGLGFNAKAVQSFLGLKKDEVSLLAAVSPKSGRFDDPMPELVRDHLEEIALTIHMVAKMFGDDVNKTVAWFHARNPLLGNVSPCDMIRPARFERLRKFIISAMMDTAPVQDAASSAH